MSEFELSKQSYIDKHNHSLVMGLTHDDFRRQKIQWVAEFVGEFKPGHVLDFGFGPGELLEDLLKLKTIPKISGVEPSETMRAELTKRNAESAFFKIAPSLEAFPDGSLDLITCSNVLHHVPPADRAEVANQMFKKLKPGGHLLIWEHNPLNLGTQFVVCRCEYDHDAVLLRRSETRRLFSTLTLEKSEYVNFTPPSFQKSGFFRKLDALLKSVPLGAQYRLTLRKPA